MKNKMSGFNPWRSYLDPLLVAVDLQRTAAVFGEGRHVEIEGWRSALALLHKIHNINTHRHIKRLGESEHL